MISPVVFVGSLVIIYFHEYLIPGTPWLTKRYLPVWVLKTFDKAETHTESTLHPESELRELGLIEIDAETDDLVLTSVFTDAWFEAIADRTTSDAAIEMGVATLLAIDPEDLEVAEQVTSFTGNQGESLASSGRRGCQCDPRWNRRCQMGIEGGLSGRHRWIPRPQPDRSNLEPPINNRANGAPRHVAALSRDLPELWR
ncbi:hypothetical protein [Natrarchaeobaculum sulfurireducens]|uniref:hypothetical protein n=1 Tax=Natrarchaeobaculum sulfurireducens TaxID=2044521 RepID=UPI00105AB056|nr:hypothetical protein [Natrarchaeobaculum sulfurireducens]